MNKRSYAKIPRKGLVLAFLIFGLVLLGTSSSRSVEATTCYEAWFNFYAADNAYYVARLSVFADSPNRCVDICAGNSDPDCVPECEANRQSALALASANLFAKALGTCTPLTVDECDQARAIADGCLSQYPYPDYSDLDERLAVYDQYSACRLASKVDTCQ
jgi:hypothetical protein